MSRSGECPVNPSSSEHWGGADDPPEVIALPDTRLLLWPDFLPGHETLFEQLATEVHWRQDRIRVHGREHAIPRLNAWYGDPGAHYSYSGLELAPNPWLPMLATLRERLQVLLQRPFNSALLNWYRDGADCMGWHSDDEPELGPDPLIATVSLGAPRRFALKHRQRRDLATWSAYLPGGSLLVMDAACQRYWRHGLPRTRKPVAGRISLTYRHVVPRAGTAGIT